MRAFPGDPSDELCDPKVVDEAVLAFVKKFGSATTRAIYENSPEIPSFDEAQASVRRLVRKKKLARSETARGGFAAWYIPEESS